METTHIPLAEAGPRVADVMLTDPGAYAPDATVADARAAFESPRHKLLLVADGARYLGAVTRDAVAGEPDDTPLARLAAPAVEPVAPDDATDRALEIAGRHDITRVPVVDVSGDLVGLVCLNGTRGAFCVRA